MKTFIKRSRIEASAKEVFDWHEAPGAFERLTPPWEKVRVLYHEGGIRDGAEVRLLVGPMPFALRWDLMHCDYRAGESFTDCQLKGPFKHWTHQHQMIPDGPAACILEDRIEYAVPGGPIVEALADIILKRKLARLFQYRHDVTREAFS